MTSEPLSPDKLENIRQLLRKIEESALAQIAERHTPAHSILELKHGIALEPSLSSPRELASLQRSTTPAFLRPTPLLPADYDDDLPTLIAVPHVDVAPPRRQVPLAALLAGLCVVAVAGIGAAAYLTGLADPLLAFLSLPGAQDRSTATVGAPVETAVSTRPPDPPAAAALPPAQSGGQAPATVREAKAREEVTDIATGATSSPVLQSGPQPARRLRESAAAGEAPAAQHDQAATVGVREGVTGGDIPAAKQSQAVAAANRQTATANETPSAKRDQARAPADRQTVTANETPIARQGQAPAPGNLPAIELNLSKLVEARAGEQSPFPIALRPLPKEEDALLLVIRGVPEEIAFSQGSAIGNEIWILPAQRAGNLEFGTPENLEGVFPLQVDLAAVDGRIVATGQTELVAKSALARSAPGVAPQSPDANWLRRIISRGDQLFEAGNIDAARLTFERAADAGSAAAAFRLAETYDRALLDRTGVSPHNGDEDRARRWYERAGALGETRAAERLRALRDARQGR